MEFLTERCYTALNADEVKIGSKVICANTLESLKHKVDTEREITEVKEIRAECDERRFRTEFSGFWPLVYLISEPEEKKLKWIDLKIGDIIQDKNGTQTYMITGIDASNESDGEGDVCHIYMGDCWYTEKELEDWEKVE